MDIDAALNRILFDVLGINEHDISDEKTLCEDLGSDSLDGMELVMQIEDEFEIDIEDSDAAEWKTVGDIKKYLKEKLERNT